MSNVKKCSESQRLYYTMPKSDERSMEYSVACTQFSSYPLKSRHVTPRMFIMKVATTKM